MPTFEKDAKVEEVVSRKAWNIQFDTGSEKFTGNSTQQLETLLKDLVIASGTLVEIHGHTDNKGSFDYNIDLSSRRALSVKNELVSTYGLGPERLTSAGAGISRSGRPRRRG